MPDDLRYWIFDRYLPQNLDIRDPATRRNYDHAYRNFETFLGRPPLLSDLTDEMLARFTLWLLDVRGLAATTANERMGRIRAFWNWAARKRHVEDFPTIGKVAVPERLPRAWREDELVKLFSACRRMRGDLGGIPAWRWWVTIHAWWWNTSERIGATLQLRCEHLQLDTGYAVVPAAIRKGKRQPRAYRLWPDLVEMLRMILPPHAPEREHVWPWPLARHSFYYHYTRLLKMAGLPHDRYSKPHRMRVSRASWSKLTGGDPTRDLGHASDATTRKHYLDPTLCDDDDGDRLFRPW